MTPGEFTHVLSQYFGYPLKQPELLAQLERELEQSGDEEEQADLLEVMLMENIHWEAEHLELNNPVECQPHVLTRHLCGLFSFRAGFIFGNTGVNTPEVALFVDMNPRNDGFPVYFQLEGEEPGGRIFDNPMQFPETNKLFFQLKRTFEEDEAAYQEAADAIREHYPNAAAVYPDWFRQYGVLQADEEPQTQKDPGGVQVWTAYDLLKPMAKVLLERAEGHGNACLSESPTLPKPGTYPPFLMANLLAPALDGRMIEAKQRASEILDKGLGVPLTQRWARLVIESAGPFTSS